LTLDDHATQAKLKKTSEHFVRGITSAVSKYVK
jgi:hypothetical protein